MASREETFAAKILINDGEATNKLKRMEQQLAAVKKRRDGDWRAVASMQKNYILNNQTDKPDTPDMAFDKIVPLQLEPTDDPSVLGIKAPKNLRARRDKLIKQFSKDDEYAEYTEVEPTEDEQR